MLDLSGGPIVGPDMAPPQKDFSAYGRIPGGPGAEEFMPVGKMSEVRGRQNHMPPPQSGMYQVGGGPIPMGQAYQSAFNRSSPPSSFAQFTVNPPPKLTPYGENINPMCREDFKGMRENFLSCLDVNGHVVDCPICNKIYNNTSKPIFIGVICFLIILCLYLFKRLMDVGYVRR